MPITLAPSRRQFLAGAVATSLALLLKDFPALAADSSRDPNRVALFSDTHINADPKKTSRDINMSDHLALALAMLAQPEYASISQLFINGDLAHIDGKPEDYQQLLKLVQPTAAQMPIHMAMGNHDHREAFWNTFPTLEYSKSKVTAMDSRQVLAIDSPLARWVMLDSMQKTNVTPGLIGPDQLAWLAAELDAHPDKPTLVLAHHNPDFPAPKVTPTSAPSTRPAATQKSVLPPNIGIQDTAAFMEILLSRKQVKAFIFGHLHTWSHKELAGLHLVNLPAIAYVFEKSQPHAWIDCQLKEAGATLTLRSLKAHKNNNESFELAWR